MFPRTTDLFHSAAAKGHQIAVVEWLLDLEGAPGAQPSRLSRHEGAVLRSVLSERKERPEEWSEHWRQLEEEAFS